VKFKERISLLFRLLSILTVATSFNKVIHGQNPPAPDKSQLPKFEYEDKCGNPLYESMAWSMVTGRVVEVLDGSTITIVLDNKKKRLVHLVATAAPDLKEDVGKAAHKMLADMVLGKTVEVLVNPSNAKAEELVGEISGVNRKLIEMGLVRYKQPPPYSMSNYLACVYRIIEAEAQKAKRGLWR